MLHRLHKETASPFLHNVLNSFHFCAHNFSVESSLRIATRDVILSQVIKHSAVIATHRACQTGGAPFTTQSVTPPLSLPQGADEESSIEMNTQSGGL